MPDMINLVQRQRLAFIVEGTKFTKLRREGGSRHVYVKLNPNHKTLYYGDWSESDASPSLDSLPNKIVVADIKDFRIGADSASQTSGGRDARRNRGVDTSSHLAMTIATDNSSIDLLASEQKTFDYWCDAINALLRRDMSSNKAKEDVELFLSMEIKIRLLDVEAIPLPREKPVIPPPPPPIGIKSH
jgi:engulfment/cell motility protein 1